VAKEALAVLRQDSNHRVVGATMEDLLPWHITKCTYLVIIFTEIDNWSAGSYVHD
jgi:hypothetical protein